MPAKTNTNTRRKPAVRRTPSTRNKKNKKVRTMPVWLRNILAICIVLVFSAGFYWFFIRPYAYRWKPCNGEKGYGVCMPTEYDIHGIDVSHYQGDIDWEKLANNKDTRFPLYYVDSVKYENKWHFWQHTDVGNVPGIEKEVDLNVFNGTLEELQALTLQK